MFCKLTAYTGLRKQEAIDLDFDNIDFKENIIRVKGKGNKEKVVHIKQGLSDKFLPIYRMNSL